MKRLLTTYLLSATLACAGELGFSHMEDGDRIEVTSHATGCFHNTLSYYEVRKSHGVCSFREYDITWDRSNPPKIIEKKLLGDIPLTPQEIQGLDGLLKFYREEKQVGSTSQESLLVEYYEKGDLVKVERLFDGSGGYGLESRQDVLTFWALSRRCQNQGSGQPAATAFHRGSFSLPNPAPTPFLRCVVTSDADGWPRAIDPPHAVQACWLRRSDRRFPTVLHADETGVRFADKTHWLHRASTAGLTLYSHSAKRGMERLGNAGVLPRYRGKLRHDCWGPYDKLEHCEHLRCNAHLLRELKACAEDGRLWAAALGATLVAMQQARDEAMQGHASRAAKQRREELETRYDEWIGKGQLAHPVVEKIRFKQGRARQSTEHNLLMRSCAMKEAVLGFLSEPDLPFDNNQAERDLRMMKVPQKVSGWFRGEAGAKAFCVVRSCLATARKQSVNSIDSIRNAVLRSPLPFVIGAELLR